MRHVALCAVLAACRATPASNEATAPSPLPSQTVDCDMSKPAKGGCPHVESPNAYRAACDTHRCVAIKN